VAAFAFMTLSSQPLAGNLLQTAEGGKVLRFQIQERLPSPSFRRSILRGRLHVNADDAAFEGQVSIERIETPSAPADAGVLTVKFVHYPGAQQLIVWLPRGWHEGYEDVFLLRDGVETWRETVRRKINGSVQMLFATLSWPPGDYLIAVTHKDGWRHEVALCKHAPDWRPPPPPAPPPEPPRAEPDVWRDGAGNVIPQVDLEIRAELKAKIERRFGRHLEFEGNFRAGAVIYDDGRYRISFPNEMSGGDLKCSIDVPTAQQWEAATGAPLSERDEIIAWVAERVRIEQASTWAYRITPNSIDFY
jgi:hypothetical protein